MKRFKDYSSVILLAIIIAMAFPTQVFAYLDPGTGSFLIQFLIGGVAVVGASVGIFWSKIKAIFNKNKEN